MTAWRGRAVIELLGVAASGKSGLAYELARNPGTVVVKDHGCRDLPWLAGGAVRAWPVLLQRPAGASRRRWAAWAARLAAAPDVVEHRAGELGRLVVLDQGPAYALGRMAELRRTAWGSHWWYRQVCATAGLLDVLVVLNADPEVLSERLHGRAKQHRATMLDDVQTRRYLREERATCRLVADVLARAGTRLVELDTGRTSIPDQVARIQAALEGAARPGRRRQ